MPNQKSSTAQDLARGKPSEIDFLNGYVVRKGAELGIPTPTNQALQVMVKLVERSKALSSSEERGENGRLEDDDGEPELTAKHRCAYSRPATNRQQKARKWISD